MSVLLNRNFSKMFVIPLKTRFIIFLNIMENFSEVSVVLLNVRKKMQLHVKMGN